MLPRGEYIPLESAIASLRREFPEALKAIAKAINSFDPRTEFDRETITGSKYGNSIPGFALTYGQLGAYLDIAVSKYASVLIETEVGVIESSHVAVNREWLLNQREYAAHQPEVIREVALRSYASKGATVTPILPQLEDQTPEVARTELRKLKIRIERNLTIGSDDQRDREIERLQGLLDISNADKVAATDEKTALARMVKTLTIENDQLRKARAQTAQPFVSVQPTASKAKKHTPTNVEIFNEEVRATRKAVAERARPLWLHEDFADHRTMDMVRTIRCLAETEPMGRLPETDEVLARWLSEDAAPPFAKRPGRPRKEKSKK
ncbi:hypothetical protein MKZ87_13935 [Pseudomonas sp. MCal1]|uniref:hypothetical protein n=1 Tax=Pseudomonas sp. MCal1 TaxID=2919887 RepID=UPI00225AF521|nr:hypothetical protein [Pseudomonas sp. MCal1]MCX4218740.1 hypothetical protein [Pseudomonas sp. MCal1]